jgi:hypothetical protein
MTEPLCSRKTPCSSCPYRKNVPSGLWEEEEYDKLIKYDQPTWGQPTGLFLCHQQDGTLCAGWVAHNDPAELLAIRLGLIAGTVDPSVIDYTTSVPLFPSGTAAAEHGMQQIDAPDDRAMKAIDKLIRSRDLRESSLEFDDED